MTVTSHPNIDHADGPDTVGMMVDRLARAGVDILLPQVKIGRFSGFDESSERGRNRKHPAWVRWVEWRLWVL
jgi:hypothetical protein